MHLTKLKTLRTLTLKGEEGPVTVALVREKPTNARLYRDGVTHTFQARLNARVYRSRRVVGKPGDLLAEFLTLKGAEVWCENEGVVIETRRLK